MCNDQSSIFNASAPVPKLKRHQLLEGQRRLHFILRARELRAAGQTWDAIARATNIPFSTLIRWEKQAEENRLGRLKSIGHLDFVISHSALSAADCAPQNHKSGRPRKFRLTAAEVAKIKSISLPINRNSTDTSTPEAIRRALASGMFSRSDVGSSDSLCPDRVGPPSAQDILAREANGQPLLTRTMRDQVRLTEMQVRAFRSPNEANLDYIQSPGSLMLTRDELTGEERFFQPGEAYTIDDGSINFGCCVDRKSVV